MLHVCGTTRVYGTRPSLDPQRLVNAVRSVVQWVLLLALGGFIGNFVFSLTDRGRILPLSGCHCLECSPWVPGFFSQPADPFLELSAAVLAAQALVGVVGFGRMRRRFWVSQVRRSSILTAPPMAPMLFRIWSSWASASGLFANPVRQRAMQLAGVGVRLIKAARWTDPTGGCPRLGCPTSIRV